MTKSTDDGADEEATRVDLVAPRSIPAMSVPSFDGVDLSVEPVPDRARAPESRPPPDSVPPLESIPPLASLDEETQERWTIDDRPVTLGLRSVDASASTILGHDVVRSERTGRARAGLVGAAAISLVGLLLLQVSSVRPPTHWVVTGALALLAAVSIARRIQLSKDGDERSSALSAAVGIAGAVVSVAVVAHMGLLTSVTMILPVVVYTLAYSDEPWRAWTPFLLCAAGYFALVVLGYAEVLPLDQAVLEVELPRRRGILLMGLFGEAVLAVTFFLGRRGRKETLLALERLDRAHREIVGREALLDEARAELEEALGAGKVGRFSGRRIADWTIHEVIGRGGMGEVYRGVDDAGRPAALKVLHPQAQEDRAQLERFFREARISSDLDSPHIVSVVGSGTANDGSPYLAMELLAGYDLADVLRRQRRLRLRDALELVDHVAQALAVAQDAGIVHRDLKPQNVFRTGGVGGGAWKVLDFGVSKMVDAGVTLTRDAVVGTPSYMSPEQARGLPVNHRSDVFSLGSIAYRAITGRPAFHAGEPLVALNNVIQKMPTRPSELANVPEDVDLALALALAKDRDRRFRSAVSFAAALRDASRGEVDERLREGAREVLAEHPWGTVERDQHSLRPSARPSPSPNERRA